MPSQLGVRGSLGQLSARGRCYAVRVSRKTDLFSLQHGVKGQLRVAAAYKRKEDKVRPVNAASHDGSKPEGLANWKIAIWEQLKPLQMDSSCAKYDQWFTPKFSRIARGARMTPERAERMICGDMLTDQEREVMLEMLYKREAALAWNFDEIGRVRDEVAAPQLIKTVDHEPWQVAGFPVPKALKGTVIQMLKERLAAGLLEHCDGAYRNPWFLVKKKSGTYRLVDAAMHINRVTIKDSNLPPDVDEFSEDFAGMYVSSLIDFLSGYDQVTLPRQCRDLTAIMTPLGLLRHTTLLQGATNSVAQFVRVVTNILEDLMPDVARAFVDDVGVKGPKTRYNDKEVAPGVRRFILEHIQNLDKVLVNCELAGSTISGEKSQFCMSGMKIVGFVCDSDGGGLIPQR